jgi:hypothetical protein
LRLPPASTKIAAVPAIASGLMRCFRLTANRPQLLCIVLVALAWLQLAFLPLPPEAQSSVSPSTGSLQISVCDTQGNPLAGAIIHLQLQGDSFILDTRTDAHGQ